LIDRQFDKTPNLAVHQIEQPTVFRPLAQSSGDYPAPLDDYVTAYRALLRQTAPETIIIGRASAGGNFSAATILRARDEGLPLPAVAVLLTPEIDLTEGGDSFHTLLSVDSPQSLDDFEEMRKRTGKAIDPHDQQGVPLPYQLERSSQFGPIPAAATCRILENDSAALGPQRIKLNRGVLFVRRDADVADQGHLSHFI
jgi:acetyl esterase/lipase